VSYEPAEDGGVEPRGLATAMSFQGPLPRRRRIFPGVRRGTRRSRPPPPVRPSAFEAAPATRQVLVPRMAADTIRWGYPSFAFQTKPARLSGSPSTRGRWTTRKPTPRGVAPASNGARRACPVHLPHCHHPAV